MNAHRGWPPLIVAFAEIIGDGAALKMIAAFGGTTIYIPKTPRLNSRLVSAIGAASALALAARFGGEDLEIPNGAAMRSKKLMIARMAGSNAQIARATGTTRRYVRRVKNRGYRGLDPRQRELFKP